MRSPVVLLTALSVLACDLTDTTSCRGCLTTSPPTPNLSSKIRVLPVAGGAPSLEVSVSLMNGTSTSFVVLQCPLVIHFSPYPPGSYSTSGSDQCPSGAPARPLTPGDTSVITRVLSADTLASFAPGQYRVAVSVTFHVVNRTDGNTVAGNSAGIVQLPLDSSSQ
jgi:hypothetical protein